MNHIFRYHATRFWRTKVAVFMAAVCLCVCAMIFYLDSSHANRADLQLQVELFLDGQVKVNKWLPVKLTVSNSGDDVKGFIAWKLGSSRQAGDYGFVKELELPAGSMKEVWISVPAHALHGNNNEIVFYEGSLSDKNEISFTGGKKSIRTDLVSDDTTLIGVLASDADAFRFLAGFVQEGYDVRVHELSLELFPAQASYLELLDVIILNDFASSSFSPEQIQSLTEWVRKGGTLIVSGGAGYAQTVSNIQELAPVWGNDTVSVEQLPALEQKTGEALVFDRPYTLSKGQLTPESEAWIWHEDIPLIAHKPFGKGTVWYVAMDFSLQPFVTWNGQLSLWRYLLLDHLQVSGANPTSQGQYWELDNALTVFAQLKPPSFGLLVLAFFIYIFIVAPFLYILLKLWDRRGFAWFLIPIIAISFSVGIYSIGAKDRGQTLAQSLGIVQLFGDGYGHRTAATSVFVPKGGSYDVKLAESKQAAPFWERIERSHLRELTGNIEGWIDQKENDADWLRFERVPYWSTRNFWMEDRLTESYGHFQLDIHVEDTTIKGEVTNKTEQTLTDVHIVYQGTAYSLGTMDSGETSPFQLDASGTNAHIRNIPHHVFPYMSEDRDQYKRALLSTVLQMIARETNNNNPAIIVGFNEGKGSPLQIAGETIIPFETNVWVQPLDLIFVQEGMVSIPYGSMEATLVKSDVSFIAPTFDGWMEIGEGELEFAYYLPQQAIGSRFHMMQLAYESRQSITYSIWNGEAGEWEPLDWQSTSKTWTLVDPYIIEDEFIRIKVKNTAEYEQLRIPEIALEGEIGP